jgi:hypothetical protein
MTQLQTPIDNFTDQANTVLELAKEEARSAQSDELGSEHILLGLLADRRGRMCLALKAFGITLGDARAEVRDLAKPESHNSAEPQLTAQSQRTIDKARETAVSSGFPAAECEHLLLALIDDASCTAANVLKTMGVDLKVLAMRINEQLDDLKVRSTLVLPPEFSSDTTIAIVFQKRSSGALPPLDCQQGDVVLAALMIPPDNIFRPRPIIILQDQSRFLGGVLMVPLMVQGPKLAGPRIGVPIDMDSPHLEAMGLNANYFIDCGYFGALNPLQLICKLGVTPSDVFLEVYDIVFRTNRPNA